MSLPRLRGHPSWSTTFRPRRVAACNIVIRREFLSACLSSATGGKRHTVGFARRFPIPPRHLRTKRTAALESLNRLRKNARGAGDRSAGGDSRGSERHFASFSGASVRSATSADGTFFWIAGATSGVQCVGLGGMASFAIAAAPANNRVLSIFGGQLYGTSGTLGNNAVFTVGSGLPSVAGQTTTVLPGMSVVAGPSPDAFQLFDASASVTGLDLLYVADDRAAASAGGVQRWTFDGTTWTLGATFNLGNGAYGLTGYRVGTLTYLYATTANGRVVEIVDDGASTPTPTTIATAVTNTTYRGLALAPF
jgi:hypothetical protein